jgi:hypothetical protein
MFERITLAGALVLGAVSSCSNDDKDDQSGRGGQAGGGASGAGAANAGGTRSGGTAGQSARGGTTNESGGAAPTAGSAGALMVPSGGLGGEPGSENGGSGGEDEGTTGGNAGPGGSSTGGNSNGGSATGGEMAMGGAGGAGELCGGVVCAPGLACCGLPECGYCINPDTSPACATSCPRRACGDEGLECLSQQIGYPGELCVESEFTIGPSAERRWECQRNPCAIGTVDCDCAGDLCAELDPRTTCSGVGLEEDTLRCTGGGPCNSPDTPIATPGGERAIASLEPGDLVYSMDRDSLSAVPVQRVGRTAVRRHEVVRITLASGAVLEISAGHPTADGRTFHELDAGSSLDGVSIVAREVIPYRHAYTYDILPASDTGTYVAGGVLIGSTLATSSLPARCGTP